MSGRAEAACGSAEEACDVLCRRLVGEEAEGERHSREDVEDDAELEVEESKESSDVGEIGHGDVVGIASVDGAEGG